MTQENKVDFASIKNSLEKYFLEEYPVSTLLQIQIIDGTPFEKKTIPELIVSEINLKSTLNFVGSDGLYYSRTACNNYTKYKVVENAIFVVQGIVRKTNAKIVWFLSNPIFVPNNKFEIKQVNTTYE